MALTRIQRNVARSLFIARPEVIPGTRAILDEKSKKTWYDKVAAAMKTSKVKDADVNAFCDTAGVAD